MYEFNLGYYFHILLYASGSTTFMCINRTNKEFLFLVLYIHNIKSFISKYEEDSSKVKDQAGYVEQCVDDYNKLVIEIICN